MLPITQAPKLALGLLAALSIALAGCLLTPGRFTSELEVRKDGTFRFAYAGEIHLVALTKLADTGAKETFSVSPCHSDDDFSERPCTPADIKQQKEAWEAARASAADKRRQDAESMKTILGGIDPADPRAGEEFAARLRRQAGWRKVAYKGNGLFDVDFALSGRLDHDFTFPTIERFPLAVSFIQIVRRADGTVRIDAPAFGPAQSGEPLRGMSGLMANGEADDAADMPVIDGRFTIRTDGAILANNTDEGPQADPAGQRLDWAVNPRSPAAPTALIKVN